MSASKEEERAAILAGRIPATFTQEDIRVDIDEIVLGPCIGKGNFASVYIGRYFGDVVAVKKQKKGPDIARYIATELALLTNLQNEHLVSFVGCAESAADVYIVPVKTFMCVFVCVSLVVFRRFTHFLWYSPRATLQNGVLTRRRFETTSYWRRLTRSGKPRTSHMETSH